MLGKHSTGRFILAKEKKKKMRMILPELRKQWVP